MTKDSQRTWDKFNKEKCYIPFTYTVCYWNFYFTNKHLIQRASMQKDPTTLKEILAVLKTYKRISSPLTPSW